MTIAASFFLVLARTLRRGGKCGGGRGFTEHLLDSDSCVVGVHLRELFVGTFGLPESCGFITLALDNVAKGGALLEKLPLQSRARVTLGRQILEDP
jgi:hypothetical protein